MPARPTRIPLGFRGGIDRSISGHRADLGKFYDMFNFRHSRTQLGKVEQTPYFNLSQVSQGTYWDGAASATEPTDSSVRHHNNTAGYTITDYVVRGSAQLKVFYQTTYPAAETINTGCYVVFTNPAALAITLGSTLDIVIDGAATFKWRKNGGAYTTLLATSTSGTAIDGGNATVYFLTNTGFTVNDTWSWTRTDASFETLANVGIKKSPSYLFYKGTFFFCNLDNRVMHMQGTVGSSTECCVSVGYRPVYGKAITIFKSHLVVAQFSKTTSFTTRSNVVGWSDVTDVQNFIPTDTNEADEFSLPTTNWKDYENPTLSVQVIGQQLFVFTTKQIYASPYLGLPAVFSFTEYAYTPTAGNSAVGFKHVIAGPKNGVYIIGTDDIFFFDGGSFTSVGLPVVNVIAGSDQIGGATDTTYDEVTEELVILITPVLYTYQERWKTWFRRSVGFSSIARSVWANAGVLFIGAADRSYYSDTSWTTTQPVMDFNSGASYAVPKVTCHPISDGVLSETKEVSSTYLGIAVTSVSSTYYSSTTNCQFQLNWYSVDNGLITGSSSTDVTAVLVTSNIDGLISFPRLSFRSLALEVQVNGLVANKPPAQAVLTAIEPLVHSPSTAIER